MKYMSREELKSDIPWYFQPKSYMISSRTCQSIKFGILDYAEKKGICESDATNELLSQALNLNQKKQS